MPKVHAPTLLAALATMFIASTSAIAGHTPQLKTSASTPPPIVGMALDPSDLPNGGTPNQLAILNAINIACSPNNPANAMSAFCDDLSVALDSATTSERQQLTLQLVEQLNPRVATLAPLSSVAMSHAQFSNLKSRLRSLHATSSGTGLDEANYLRMSRNTPTNGLSFAPGSGRVSAAASQLLGERWGVFFTGSANFGDHDANGGSVPAFDFDFYDLTGGVDFRFNDRITAGAALGYTHFKADLSANAGDADSNAWSLQGFATFTLTSNLYLDATLGYTRTDFNQTRNVVVPPLITQTLHGSTNISKSDASVALNYRIYAGNGWTLTPYGSIHYADSSVDAYDESGGILALHYNDYSFQSLIGTLGLRSTWTVNLANGVLTPFADLSVRHEAGADAFQINTRFLANTVAGPTLFIGEPDRNFANLGAGASWVFASGNQLFVQVSSPLGATGTRMYSLYLGGRIEF